MAIGLNKEHVDREYELKEGLIIDDTQNKKNTKQLLNRLSSNDFYDNLRGQILTSSRNIIDQYDKSIENQLFIRLSNISAMITNMTVDIGNKTWMLNAINAQTNRILSFYDK